MRDSINSFFNALDLLDRLNITLRSLLSTEDLFKAISAFLAFAFKNIVQQVSAKILDDVLRGVFVPPIILEIFLFHIFLWVFAPIFMKITLEIDFDVEMR
jgi:hypothetical protein